ncbi:MAG: (2Fe-2S)-binding protein [Deltaproteobacteria bacterium]|nr:(2Fe-2S)-binding protein [Deltaproteobacteria bacterium]
MKNTVAIRVDGRRVEAELESPLLPALLREGFDIPTLCYHEAVSPYGACRLCLVEINQKGWDDDWWKLTTSCNFPVLDGLTVRTDSEKVKKHRKLVIELIMARCPGSREVRDVAERLGVMDVRLRKQDEDCILCGLCARVCDEIVGVNALTFHGRGGAKNMSTPYAEASAECIACGACVFVCPVGCIKLTQTGTTRTIDRWGRTLELAASTHSGIAFAPQTQLEHFRERADLPKSFYDTAPGELERK